MGNLEGYRIDLKGMQTDSCTYEFVLDDSFFAGLEGSEIQRGDVHVSLSVKKTSRAFELDFQTDGIVRIPCDRCLDEMEQAVKSTDSLVVKFGAEYAEEADNLVIVPEDEGFINVAWFMYEFVALAIPMKHVHAPGECNEQMSQALRKHLRVTPDDVDDEPVLLDEDMAESGNGEASGVDPRWNELKKILDNN